MSLVECHQLCHHVLCSREVQLGMCLQAGKTQVPHSTFAGPWGEIPLQQVFPPPHVCKYGRGDLHWGLCSTFAGAWGEIYLQGISLHIPANERGRGGVVVPPPCLQPTIRIAVSNACLLSCGLALCASSSCNL